MVAQINEDDDVAEEKPVADLPAKRPKEKKRKSTDGFVAKAEKRLRGSRFRILNEKLYTGSSEDTLELFRSDPEAFEEYHEGYREQMSDWPENPNQTIAKWLQKK